MEKNKHNEKRDKDKLDRKKMMKELRKLFKEKSLKVDKSTGEVMCNTSTHQYTFHPPSGYVRIDSFYPDLGVNEDASKLPEADKRELKDQVTICCDEIVIPTGGLWPPMIFKLKGEEIARVTVSYFGMNKI